MSNEFLPQIKERKFLSPVLSDKRFGTYATEPLTQLFQLPAFERLSARYKLPGVTAVIDQVLYELIDFRLKLNPTEDEVCNQTFKLFEHLHGNYTLPFTRSIATKQEHQYFIDYRAMTNAAILWGKALYIAKQTSQPIQQFSFQDLYEEQMQIIREEGDYFKEGITPTPITNALEQMLFQEPVTS